MGLITPQSQSADTIPSDQDGMALLKQAEQNIDQKVPDKYRRDYLALVVAGRKILFSDQTQPIIQKFLAEMKAGVKGPQDLSKWAARGAAELLGIILLELKRTGKQIPVEASGLAIVVFMLYVLKYAGQELNIPITKAMIDQATIATVNMYTYLFKIDRQKMVQAFQQGGQAQQGQPVPAQPTTQEVA